VILRRFNGLNIKRLNEINCHRGKRHRNNLPVRGQRTRTNARSKRGSKKTVTGKKITLFVMDLFKKFYMAQTTRKSNSKKDKK
jgi:hypothetical protein